MSLNRRDFAKTAAAATLLPITTAIASEVAAQTVAKKASRGLFAYGIVEDETVTVPKSMACLFRMGVHNFSVVPTSGPIDVATLSFMSPIIKDPMFSLISIIHKESGATDIYSHDGKHFVRSGVWVLDSLGHTGNEDPNFEFNKLKIMNDESVEDRMNKIMEESNISSFYLQKSIAKWNDIHHKTDFMKAHRQITQSLKRKNVKDDPFD